MKPRRNTADSDTALRTSSGRPSTSSVEMNAWPRRNARPQLEPLDFGRQQQQQQPPPSSQQQPRTPISPVSPRTQHYQFQQPSLRAPARRNSRTPRPPPLMTVDYNGESMFFPLSPAPVKKHDSTATSRLVLSDDSSDVLPPDDIRRPSVPTVAVAVPPPAVTGTTATTGATTGASTHVRIIHASQPGPPSIYWSDDGTSMAGTDAMTIRTAAGTVATNPSAFTFYREDADDDSDCGDGDPRRSNRGSRRLSRLSRLSRVTTTTTTTSSAAAAAGTPRDHEKRRSSLCATMGRAAARRGSAPKKETNKEDKETAARRVSIASDDDDLEEDGIDANGLRLEGRHTAEFEFVNGRYVPPALRNNGRAPGRKPVNEVRELERELERKRKQGRYHHHHHFGGGRRTTTNIDPELGEQHHVNGNANDDDDDDDDNAEHGLRINRGSPSFWCVVGIVLFFVIAIAVGVGTGVGLTMSRH